MTHGHFHAVRDRVEVYAVIRGEGALILMDESRNTWMEPMRAGSVHYVRGGLAHRVANTGGLPLAFIACWPSDAGHDYESILKAGFGARLREAGGRPVLVPEESLAGAGN
jgi:glucose-6-phosphate isomerase